MVKHSRIFGRTLIITTIIFVIGIIVGYYMDNFRTNDALTGLRNSELDSQSYLTEQEFFEEFGGYNCDIAGKRLDGLSRQLGEMGYYLVNYEKKNVFKQEDYEYLLRKYFLMEVKTYTQFSKLNNECKLNKTLILFFYDPDDSVSDRQGKILDALVKKDMGVSVFSINFDYKGDALLDALKIYHNITRSPTIVLNNEKVEGFTGIDEISAKIKSRGG